LNNKYKALVNNWKIWGSRLGLKDPFWAIVGEVDRLAQQGRDIPGETVEHIARFISKAQSRVPVEAPAETTGADAATLESLGWMLSEIQRAARSVAYKWPQVTSAGDMANEIWLRLVESKGSVQTLAAMSPDERAACLVKIGHQIASGMRDDLDYFSGQFTYSVQEVRTLLEKDVLCYEVAGFSAATHDIWSALGRVSPRYRELLYRKYRDGETFTKNSAEERAVVRAVESLTRMMNRSRKTDEYEYHNGNRARSSVSSGRARAIVDVDYYGEEQE